MRLINRFLREEEGQDLVEYTLLLAFVALASAALFLTSGDSVRTIWTNANAKLVDAQGRLN